MKHRLPYEPALDGLRGLAVLSVMVFHAVPAALSGGFLGVDVFFVLSGYLITSLLLVEYAANKRIDFLHFFARRWRRLAPALLAMLTLYGLANWLFVLNATLDNQGTDILLTLLYLTNWARALALKESVDLGHTWSLAVEWQFYMVWPFLFCLLMRLLPQKIMLLGSVVSMALLSLGVRLYWMHHGASVERLYNGLDTRVETLMWGAALAVWMSMRKPAVIGEMRGISKIAGSAAWAWLIVLAILALFATTQWTSPKYYQAGITLMAGLSALLMVYLIRPEKTALKHLLLHPWLVWLGAVSYGLYLWHFPIYKMLLSFDLTGWRLLTSGILITLSVAALSYYYLERPLLDSKK